MKALASTLLSALLVSAICLMTGAAQAQAVPSSPRDRGAITCSPAPCVLPPKQVSEGGEEVTDTAIVADPLNPKHLLLGSEDFNCLSGMGFFTSLDGGSIWNRTCLEQNVGLWAPSYDPIVGYDRKGGMYIGGIYYRDGYSTGLVGVERSTDGIQWSKPVRALQEGSHPNEPWLAVDTNVGSPYLNSVYVSAVIVNDYYGLERVYVSHSRDEGATWQPVSVAPAQTGAAGDANTTITVGKDGTVYVVWMYCDVGPYFCTNYKADMVFSKSSDGGNTWSFPTSITTVNLLPTLLPNTHVGIGNIPVVGVDASNGPNSGNLYVAMYTWTGAYGQVQVSRSVDGGNTWLNPVPVAPPSDNHDQFFPWLSVSPNGLVGVSWLDRRNDPANIDYQAFAAISSDGGQTFPNVQLTTAFSNPNNNGGGDWMGDYTGNTWDGPNFFVAAWMDNSNGVNIQDVVGGIRLH
jgi:hypothetical protein